MKWLKQLLHRRNPVPEAAPTLSLGTWAEARAEAYLRACGLELLTRNYRSRRGECDLIMRQGQTLVFVEVRYRRDSYHGTPAESVDWRKQRKLRACADYYLQRHPRLARKPCRFDIVSLSGERADPQVEWIPGAFV